MIHIELTAEEYLLIIGILTCLNAIILYVSRLYIKTLRNKYEEAKIIAFEALNKNNLPNKAELWESVKKPESENSFR